MSLAGCVADRYSDGVNEHRLTRVVACAALASWSLACTAQSDLFGTPTGAGGIGSGPGPQGPGPTTDSSSSTTSNGGSSTTSAVGGAGGAGAGGGSCAPVSETVALDQLDLILLADRSGSMATNNKYSAQVGGITQFVQGVSPAGTRVALIYHPAQNVADVCPPALYGPAVPLTPVPGLSAALTTSLTGQFAGGNSPWSPELHGAYQYASTVQAAGRAVAVVFMVDTLPNICDLITDNAAVLAATALTSGVRTFAIAFQGVVVSEVSKVSNSGGTGQAIDLTGMGAIGQLGAQLAQISFRAVPCEYDIPPVIANEDPNTVQVVYSPGGMNPQILPRVSGAGLCGNTLSWYFDNAMSPTKVMLCSTSCNAIKQDAAAVVELEAGCPLPG